MDESLGCRTVKHAQRGNSNLLLCLSTIGEIQFSVILFRLTYSLKVQFGGIYTKLAFSIFLLYASMEI